MKKVLSIRVSHKTIVQCYDIADKYGKFSKYISMGSAIVIGLEAMLGGLERIGEICQYTEEEVETRMRQIFKEISPVENEAIPAFSAAPIVSVAPEVPSLSKDRIQEAIEQEMAEIERQEDSVLVDSIKVDAIYKATPEAIEVISPKAPPWEGKELTSTSRLVGDRVYEAAKDLGELAVTAVQVVYAKLPKELWGGDKALELVRETYRIFKEWEEKQGS